VPLRKEDLERDGRDKFGRFGGRIKITAIYLKPMSGGIP